MGQLAKAFPQIDNPFLPNGHYRWFHPHCLCPVLDLSSVGAVCSGETGTGGEAETPGSGHHGNIDAMQVG